MNEIVLGGCTATPLASYLKAVAVLRLLASEDPEARGSWCADRFVLVTRLDEDDLMSFFHQRYEPTPVVAPWNGGSGFYEKDNKAAMQAILSSRSPRLSAYQECLRVAECALAGRDRNASPKGGDKANLMASMRSLLPESALEWFDAAVLLAGDTPKYPPLLGTGGNDGRLDFTNNFMQRLGEALCGFEGPPSSDARAWLEMALFGTASPGLVKKAIGQYAPGQAGGPNAGMGFDVDGAINPWDFVLMIEGAVMFAAAAVRRHADDPAALLSYPFTVRGVTAGAGSLGEGDACRGEIWLPLWHRPARYSELRALLAEGRVALGKKPARDALDFARAVQRLGGYRGVHAFQRYGILKRNGDAHFATPLSRVVVADEPAPSVLEELDRHAWLDRFRQFARGDNAASRFLSLRRQVEDRLFDLAGHDPTPAEMQALLVLLGEVQHALSCSNMARDVVQPIPRLSEQWVIQADDGSPEFRIAKALAGLRGVGDVALPLRAQVFPVQRKADRWMTPEAGEAVRFHVTHRGQLADAVAALLSRRLWLMERLAMTDKPLSSPSAARLDDLAAFLGNPRMDARIQALLPGLCLCRIPLDAEREAGDGRLPAAFGLMKLALTPDSDLRSLGYLGPDEHLPAPAGMLATLRAGNPGNRAVTLAWRRLRASGLTPCAGAALPLLAGVDSERAAAALLIPLRWGATAALARALLDMPEALNTPNPPRTQLLT